MAIYHFCVKLLTRRKKRSAVLAAAYQAGEKITDSRINLTKDYTKRRRPNHTEIMVPQMEDLPDWLEGKVDREVLWNQVEAAEKRSDAQVARLLQLSLPCELTIPQQIVLVRDYIQAVFVQNGMIADISLHSPPSKGSEKNYYACVLLTTRKLTNTGFGKKNRHWNSPHLLRRWRVLWAEAVNVALKKAGFNIQVTHESNSEQKKELTTKESLPTQNLEDKDIKETKLHETLLAKNSELVQLIKKFERRLENLEKKLEKKT